MVVELSDYIPINFICLAVLGALVLRKVVRMDGYHWLRVALLTALLWVPVLYLFSSFFTYIYPPDFGCCTPQCGGSDAYTITEV